MEVAELIPLVPALSRTRLAYLVQFVHPEKILQRLPGISEEAAAMCYGVDAAVLGEIKARLAVARRAAAYQLLDEPGFAARIDRLPFRPRSKIVGLGDSMTDDAQSWLEILRELLAIRRAGDGISVVNAGVSGDTSTHAIARFPAVAAENPDWIFCMLGANDARIQGISTSTLVSPQETARNLTLLRRCALSQTKARWLWLTQPEVMEDRIASHWFLKAGQSAFRNRDLREIADIVRVQSEPVIDIRKAFAAADLPQLLLDDGLHPSLAGHIAIVRSVVEHLSPY